jgi:hypothetical protein
MLTINIVFLKLRERLAPTGHDRNRRAERLCNAAFQPDQGYEAYRSQHHLAHCTPLAWSQSRACQSGQPATPIANHPLAKLNTT